jgi:hypothetical protein
MSRPVSAPASSTVPERTDGSPQSEQKDCLCQRAPGSASDNDEPIHARIHRLARGESSSRREHDAAVIVNGVARARAAPSDVTLTGRGAARSSQGRPEAADWYRER